jgi:hypothetical protein
VSADLIPGPADFEAASAEWGANCGPASLAAALGVQLADVRAAVSEKGKFRGYMTITHMKQAIHDMGERVVRIHATQTRPYEFCLQHRVNRPHVRIVCVAWYGPWSVNPRAAAAHRHWIAAQGGMVYDVNSNDWMPAVLWEDNAHLLYPKRATGHTFTWLADLRDAKGWRGHA